MFSLYKHVHFVGIGGMGMSALAKWFLHEGVHVSGSDLQMSPHTHELERRGAKIYPGHAPMNLADDVDLLIYSPAVSPSNVERVAARERGIHEWSNVEVLGELSKSFTTIVVSGTNGKSTTTAMLGLMLEAAGLDPTVLVGSLVPGFAEGNFRYGTGRFFIVEGCEYRANMLNFRPMMAVLTNIEEDHLDYYRDLKHLQETFQKFVGQVSGTVVVNADDPGSAVLTAKSLLTYGSSMSDATYAFTSRNIEIGMQRITTNIGHFELQIPGEFNVYNAMAATAAAMELGVPFATCAQVLKKFRGIWRRFERIGVWKGADIISDYGHHPSAIQQTVEATREFFPGRRIVLCYQPHQHDRTKKLFQEFVEVLPLADVTIVTEIFDVAGRNEGQDVSSRDVVEAINRSHRSNAIYASDLSAAQTQLCDLIQPRDIVLIMGAGDIDDVARRLV